MTLSFAGVDYTVTKAVKGPDFVIAYNGEEMVLSCFEVSDFSDFTLTDGEWSDPDPDLDVIASGATLSNGSIVITANGFIGTGTLLKFTAPCDCTDVTGGLVIDGKTYTVVDALTECVTGKGGAWASGAQVSVLIDKTNLRAFIQNSAKPGGVLHIEHGGTGATDADTARAKLGAAPAYTYGTEDLEAGVTALETGKIYLVYE